MTDSLQIFNSYIASLSFTCMCMCIRRILRSCYEPLEIWPCYRFLFLSTFSRWHILL